MPFLIRTFILLNIVNSAVAGFFPTCDTQESTITKHAITITNHEETIALMKEKLKEKDVEIAKVRTLMASSCKDMLFQIGVAAKALGNAVDSHTCKTEVNSCQMQLEALRSSCCDKFDNNGQVIKTFTTSCASEKTAHNNCELNSDGSWKYSESGGNHPKRKYPGREYRRMNICGEGSCTPGSRLHGKWEIYDMKKTALWKVDGVCYTNPAS